MFFCFLILLCILDPEQGTFFVLILVDLTLLQSCNLKKSYKGLGGPMSQVVGLPNNSYKLITIQHGFAPGFVNYKKGCTRLTAASIKVYELLAHGRWFSPGTPASSTTKTGHHDIAEILLKVTLNTKNQSIKHQLPVDKHQHVQNVPCQS